MTDTTKQLILDYFPGTDAKFNKNGMAYLSAIFTIPGEGSLKWLSADTLLFMVSEIRKSMVFMQKQYDAEALSDLHAMISLLHTLPLALATLESEVMRRQADLKRRNG